MSAILDALRKREPAGPGPASKLTKTTASSVVLGTPRNVQVAVSPSNTLNQLWLVVLVALFCVPASVFSALWVAKSLWIQQPPAQVASLAPASESAKLPEPNENKPAAEKVIETNPVAPAQSITQPAVQLVTPLNISVPSAPPPAGQPVASQPPMMQPMVAMSWPYYYYAAPMTAGMAPAMNAAPHPGGMPYQPLPGTQAATLEMEPPAKEQPAIAPRKKSPVAAEIKAKEPSETRATASVNNARKRPKDIHFDGILGNQVIFNNDLLSVGDEVDGLIISEIGADFVAFQGTEERAYLR